jgi:hypothetical protein
VPAADGLTAEATSAAFGLRRPLSLDDGGRRARIHVTFRALIEECPDPRAMTLMDIDIGNNNDIGIVLSRVSADCVATLRDVIHPPPIDPTCGGSAAGHPPGEPPGGFCNGPRNDFVSNTPPVSLAIGTWQDFALDFPESGPDASSATATATLTVGATTSTPLAVGAHLYPGQQQALSFVASLGVTRAAVFSPDAVGPPAGARVRFDDVTIDYQR